MMRMREVIWQWRDVWIRSGWKVQLHHANQRARLLDPSGMIVIAGTQDECTALAKKLAPSTRARRAVVLLHGLWNYPGIMHPLARALETRGWAVANFGYPSLRLPVAAHGTAASLVARALADDGATEIAFIGHSLGGLVARTAIADAVHAGWTAGRLILIGSPAYGSSVAKLCKNFPGYETLIGACAPMVTPKGARAIPPPAVDDVLVIAGGTGGRGFNPLLRGDNDGLISVAETRMLQHETQFQLVHSTHNNLPLAPATLAACVDFLTTGQAATLN
jgi:pimeloyl-ACP methyl ester carboxylesterase